MCICTNIWNVRSASPSCIYAKYYNIWTDPWRLSTNMWRVGRGHANFEFQRIWRIWRFNNTSFVMDFWLSRPCKLHIYKIQLLCRHLCTVVVVIVWWHTIKANDFCARIRRIGAARERFMMSLRCPRQVRIIDINQMWQDCVLFSVHMHNWHDA